jgi:hypothetical protein
MTRRELRMIESGNTVGAVEFDGQRLTFEGLAEPILGYLRKAVGDDQMFGADLMANGWMNMAVELAPEASRSLTPTEEDEVSRADDDEPEVDDVSDDDDDFDPEIDYHVSCIDWGDDEAERSEFDEDDIVRAMDRNQLKHYWTVGKGLRKWLGHPHPWTALYRHLRKYVGAERAKRMAAQWVHDVTGNWPGSDAHRVATGHKPRGSRIGPG